MKHMKRALSLVLAMVMLLGMMVIPTGAVSNFTDEDEVTYTEAVAVTSGIGLFAGTDGKFLPKGTVTRAQMATIIVKMLHGSEANADSFKGVNGGFTDTASFEGGWAEGYINWCASLGVVAGYGDGTFRPGKEVTTAEAVTMILNALKVDAGQGQWPITVMSKADELKFFKDLSPKPDTNKALTREELAVIAFCGLEYSPDGETEYAYNGVTYDNYMAAYLAAGSDASKVEAVKVGSLASEVFALKSITGFVTANQASGLDCTEVKTVVQGAAASYQFGIETDQAAIGHYVTVYYDELYTSESKPGKTYTIVDEANVVEVTEDIDSRAEFRTAFGSANVKLSTANACVVNADYTVKAGYPKANGFAAGDVTFTTGDTYDVPAGTYIVDGNDVVAYIAPATECASVIEGIDTYEGEAKVSLRVDGNIVDVPNDLDNDMIDEFSGMKEGDYVTYTKVGSRYVLERVRVVTGKVTAMSITKINGDPYDVVTVGGKDYVAFGGNNYTNLAAAVSGLNYDDTYDFYTTHDGKVVGYKASAGSGFNMDDVAYILGVLSTSKKDSYGDQIITFYARGVKMNGVETLIPMAQVEDTDRDGEWDEGEEILGDEAIAKGGSVAEAFYTVKDHSDRDARKKGIQALTGFGSTYDKETSPVFVVPYTMRDLQFGGRGTFGNYYAQSQSSGKYLFLEGSATQGTALSATVKTGSCSVSMDDNILSAEALLSRTDDGDYLVEAMMFRIKSEAVTTGSQTIYVSRENNKPIMQTQAGYTYEVYNAADGKATEITLATGSALAPGFYQVAFDAKELLHQFVPMADATGFIVPTQADTTVLRQSDTPAAKADGLALASVCYDLPFDSLSNNAMNAGTMKVAGVAGAVVVDVRSEDQKDASHIATISDLARVSKLKLADEGLVVQMDIYFNSSAAKAAAIYITDVQVAEEITDLTGVEAVVSGGYTLAEITNMLNANEYKIMGAIMTAYDGKTALHVTSVEEDLRKVTLSTGDIISVAEAFEADAGYVEATIVSSENYASGWRCMVKFDTATGTTAGSYRVSVDNGSIKLTLGETGPEMQLTTLNPSDELKVPESQYYNADDIRANFNDALFVVKASAITFGDVSVYNVTGAYYTVPQGVVLYMADKTLKDNATFGAFYVMDNNGTDLTEGEEYYFAIENTSDAPFFLRTNNAGVVYKPLGVYCYAWKDGVVLGSGAYGVRKGSNLNATDYLKKDGSGFGVFSDSLWFRQLGYHKMVNQVTVSGDNYTMNIVNRGCAGGNSGTHGNMGSCGDNNSNWQTTLTLTADTVIVDARTNPAEKIETLAEFEAQATAAAASGSKLIVDFLATENCNKQNAAGQDQTKGNVVGCMVIIDDPLA